MSLPPVISALRYERLSAVDQLVLLAHHAAGVYGVSSVSRAKLCLELDLQASNLRRAESRLVRAGLIRILRRHGGRVVELVSAEELLARDCDPLSGRGRT